MTTIYRKNAGRITVAEAKRLVCGKGGASPDFAGDCERLGIEPRMTHRPTITGYTGEGIYQDLMYSLTHDEFTRYAGLHGFSVAVGNGDQSLDMKQN